MNVIRKSGTSRVVRLTLDDITHAEQQTLLRLGEPPSPVPEPLAELLLGRSDSRDNMNTATNHASRWLFPGRRAGQPLHPDVLAALLNDLGIPTTAGRTAAIRQHVLEMPAPVVAEALSHHRVTTAKPASETGGTWSRYASGDHWRSPPGWPPGELVTVEYASPPVPRPNSTTNGSASPGHYLSNESMDALCADDTIVLSATSDD